MILLGYGGAVVIAILATTALSRWVRAGGPRRVALVRILAGVVAAAYAVVVFGFVASAGDDGSAAASAIAAIAVTGAVSYGAGLLRWSGSAAWLLRLGGWALMIGAAVVPSHLTLLLPLIAALAVTLYPSGPSHQEPHRGGKPRDPGNKRRRAPSGGSASGSRR
jgi:hypothetical protein